MDDNTPITWGQLKRIVEAAAYKSGLYSESSDPYEEIAQGTASIALAHLEAALDNEWQAADLAEAIAAKQKS